MDPRKDKSTPYLRSGELVAVILVFIAVLIFCQVVVSSGIFARTCTVSISPPVVTPGEPFSVMLVSNPPVTGKADTIDYMVYGINPWINSSGFSMNGSGSLIINGSRAAFYLRPDGNWYQFSDATGKYDIKSGMSFPSPESFSVGTPGNYTVDILYTTSDRTGGDPKATVTIT